MRSSAFPSGPATQPIDFALKEKGHPGGKEGRPKSKQARLQEDQLDFPGTFSARQREPTLCSEVGTPRTWDAPNWEVTGYNSTRAEPPNPLFRLPCPSGTFLFR